MGARSINVGMDSQFHDLFTFLLRSKPQNMPSIPARACARSWIIAVVDFLCVV